MSRLIIIGASGHGKVIADIGKLNGYDEIVFLDNDPMVVSCAGYPVLGTDELTTEIDGDIIIAVGKASTRKKLMDRDKDRCFPVLIHPAAILATDVKIGAGTVIMAGAVINPGAKIGRGCIINTSSSIDHDCMVGDFCHISVGAHLCGTVRVDDNSWIGAGATISNNVNICSECMIGAGAVVIKDINESGTYFGVPAKIRKDG